VPGFGLAKTTAANTAAAAVQSASMPVAATLQQKKELNRRAIIPESKIFYAMDILISLNISRVISFSGDKQ